MSQGSRWVRKAGESGKQIGQESRWVREAGGSGKQVGQRSRWIRRAGGLQIFTLLPLLQIQSPVSSSALVLCNRPHSVASPPFLSPMQRIKQIILAKSAFSSSCGCSQQQPLAVLPASGHHQVSVPNTEKDIVSGTSSDETQEGFRSTPYQTSSGQQALLRIRKGNRQQGRAHTSNADKTRYQHLQLQSSLTQMTRHWSKTQPGQHVSTKTKQAYYSWLWEM